MHVISCDVMNFCATVQYLGKRTGRRYSIDASMSDPRFARIKTDPRFRRPKKKQQKVVVDERFKSVFDKKENGKAKRAYNSS